MNLEQIDTSTTAGKAEVMRLAAEGRRVASGLAESSQFAEMMSEPSWDWKSYTYAIIADTCKPAGEDEAWIVFTPDFSPHTEESAKVMAERVGGIAVKYIRADLAGESKA